MRQQPCDRSHLRSKTRSAHPSFATSHRYRRLLGSLGDNRLKHPIRAASGASGELAIAASDALQPGRAQDRGAIVRVCHFDALTAASWNGVEVGSRFVLVIL